MHIDLDRLTQAELVDLNHRVVERLRFLGQMRAHAEMLDFRIGERVGFVSADRGRIFGVLTRYNRKTVTIIADDGLRWTVSPGLIQRLGPPSGTEFRDAATRHPAPSRLA